MDFILSFVSFLFISLILVAALSFGFMLLVWFVLAALAISVLALGRQWWRRWRFLRHASRDQHPTAGVIDVDYRDISDKE